MIEKPTNPLIAVTDNPADTLNHCQQVLLIVDLATEPQEMCYGEDESMGYHLILNCVRQALRYESERGLTTREDNVSRLEVES